MSFFVFFWWGRGVVKMHYTEFYCKILIFLLQDTEFIQKKLWQVCKWSSLVPHPLTHLAVVGFSDLLLAILISYRPTGLGQHTMKQDCHATHLFSQQVQKHQLGNSILFSNHFRLWNIAADIDFQPNLY